MVWKKILQLRQYSFQNISIRNDTITIDISTWMSTRFLQEKGYKIIFEIIPRKTKTKDIY